MIIPIISGEEVRPLRVVFVDSCQTPTNTVVIDPDVPAALSGRSLNEDQEVIIEGAEKGIHAGLDIFYALLDVISLLY